jgi:hypothetical protein
MGGFGSGRWGWHSKKTTVEDCKALDLHQLAREGSFVAGRTASVRWLRGEEETAQSQAPTTGSHLEALPGG